jgi:hypothetical protein
MSKIIDVFQTLTKDDWYALHKRIEEMQEHEGTGKPVPRSISTMFHLEQYHLVFARLVLKWYASENDDGFWKVVFAINKYQDYMKSQPFYLEDPVTVDPKVIEGMLDSSVIDTINDPEDHALILQNILCYHAQVMKRELVIV